MLLQEVIKASKASVASGKTAALAALEERDDARSRWETAQKAHQKAKERHKLAINAELVRTTLPASAILALISLYMHPTFILDQTF